MTDQSLECKVAAITGGATGLGAALGRHLRKLDYHVYLLDIDAEKCTLAADQMGAIALRADVRLRGDLIDALSIIEERHNRLDVMVNNAGICSSIPLLDLTDSDWIKTMAVNAHGAFIGLTEAAKLMIRTNSRGRILNIASTSGVRGYALSAHYCASKAAIISLTQSAAIELASYGITVNAISPGMIKTEMQERIQSDRTRYGYRTFSLDSDAAKVTLIDHWMHPEDLSGVVDCLIGPGSQFITGQNYVIDGGLLLR